MAPPMNNTVWWGGGMQRRRAPGGGRAQRGDASDCAGLKRKHSRSVPRMLHVLWLYENETPVLVNPKLLNCPGQASRGLDLPPAQKGGWHFCSCSICGRAANGRNHSLRKSGCGGSSHKRTKLEQKHFYKRPTEQAARPKPQPSAFPRSYRLLLLFLPQQTMRANASVLLLLALFVTAYAVPTTIEIWVAQDGLKFTPPDAKVRVNDVVMWRWAKGPHSVTQSQTLDACAPVPGGFDSTVKANAGDSYNLTFTQTGTVFYYCTVGQHCKNGMRAQLTILPENAPVPTNPTGTNPPSAANLMTPARAAVALIALVAGMAALL
ncbi:uncharacterized protein VTP21DRAFT_4922 [Calcarisporiella thermophila]|uniref:uncharacterized protein n=1 Tax=Calcarisporiella thermophila TaxID=911321 RepID=UPI0037428FB3